MSLQINSVHHGDCLEVMKLIDDKSVDLILTDLPYQMTKCKWDVLIPFDKMWEQFLRIAKDNAPIVLTASQPFTSMLVMSNLKMFKYEYIWEKPQGVNYANAKRQPLKNHESVLVFCKKTPVYNPQGLIHLDKPQIESNKSKTGEGKLGHITVKTETYERWVVNYPKTVQKFKQNRGLHPTQKSLDLFEYLIRTHSNEGDVVLDACAGSGTCGVACINTNRNYILIEKEKKYYDLIIDRLNCDGS